MKTSRPQSTRICFPVGEDEVVSVQIVLSAWSGLEVYSVNGAEVHRVRNEGTRTSQTFEVGTRERHKVEFRAWTEGRRLTAQAYVDGLLAHDDLASDAGGRSRWWRR